MTSPSRSKPLPVAPPTPRKKVGEEKVEEAIESDDESRGSSVVDTELSDSLSTGEVPPDITFRYKLKSQWQCETKVARVTPTHCHMCMCVLYHLPLSWLCGHLSG